MENNQTIEIKSKTIFGSRDLDILAIVASIITGAAFSLMVIKDFIGINMFLFSLIAIAGVGYTLYKDNNLEIKNFIYFGGAFLIYASVFFRLRQGVYTFLTFPTLVFLLIITTMFSAKNGAGKGILTFAYRAFAPIARLDKIFVAMSLFRKGEKEKNKKHNQILIGVLISVILLIIVIPLMMSAEAAFNKFLVDILEKINVNFKIEKFIWKTIAGAIIAIFFCGFLYTFTKDKMQGTKQSQKIIDGADNHSLIITVLSIMGFVFLVFAIVQFTSLFISKEAIIESTTFAKTARDGYFQLVVLSIINFIMVLVFTSMEKGENKSSKNIIRVLTTYFTILNIYLLVSSGYKMTLYYDAYGLSIERLLVYILLIFEFIALILLLVKIYKSDMKFIQIMVYYTVGFWAIVSLINIDAWVMKVNANRYEQEGEIDIYYIDWLSDDASAQIKQFYFDNYETISDEIKQEIDDYYFGYSQYELRSRFSYEKSKEYDVYDMEDYKSIGKLDSWLEFNVAKIQKSKDGLEILKHYYKSGYIEEVKAEKGR